MEVLEFRDRLEQEFDARREKNSRYSLRAFATFLGADHSTLSQILKGSRRVPASSIRSWARKLGMSREEAAVYVAAEHVPDAATAARQAQLLHWTAEGKSIVTEPAHWEIVRLSGMKTFRADCRWIAKQIGAGVDDVNMAFSRLLRLGLLEVRSAGTWREMTGLKSPTEREFRKLALARVREKAAEAHVKLGTRRTSKKA
jgi:uncharacterized protein (TIGR02147 family)